MTLPNRQNALAAYAQGPKAVVALVEKLVTTIVALRERASVLSAQAETL